MLVKKSKRIMALVLCSFLIMGIFNPIISINAANQEPMVKWYDYYFEESTEGLFKINVDGKYGFMDQNGKIVIPAKFNGVWDFDQGMAVAYISEQADGTFSYMSRYGYIDKSGKEIIPFKYDFVENFNDGTARVSIDNKWGIIDKTGKEIVEPKYSVMYYPYEGLIGILEGSYTDGKWGFIDTKGTQVIPPIYESIGNFSEGLAPVKLNGKFGFIDKTGKEVLPFMYEYANSFTQGLAVVRIDGKAGCIDKTGKVIVPIIYDDIQVPLDGNLIATVDWKRGLVDKTGKEITQIKYDYIDYFSDGMAVVTINNKQGYIDETGKEVIPVKYDFADNFSEGVACVGIDGKAGYIDKTGKVVIPFKYDYPSEWVDSNFNDGFAVVTLNNKLGIIDKTGKEITPINYDIIRQFKEGLALVGLSTPGAYEWDYNYSYGYVDKTGKEIIPLQYSNAESFKNGIARVEMNGKYGLLQNPLLSKTEPEAKAAETETIIAKPTASKLMLDGELIPIEAYSINGNNYFKLRDLAMMLKDTGKEFEVTWDGNANAINILTGKAYTPVGGELAVSSNSDEKIAKVTNSKVLLNGEEISFEAYIIGGNTYFKLRDVGMVIDFQVTYDNATKNIGINTSSGYVK